MRDRGSGLRSLRGSPAAGDAAVPVVLFEQLTITPFPTLIQPFPQRRLSAGRGSIAKEFVTWMSSTLKRPKRAPRAPQYRVQTSQLFLPSGIRCPSYHIAAIGNLCPDPRSAADAAVCAQLFCSACPHCGVTAPR